MAESSSEAQARRALELAEQRFLAGDVGGARQHALYALSLAPGLRDAEQAAAAYDVHAAAPDWYAVLGLRLSGDVPITHDAVKRQHRKLCLLVHLDKNPSAAAEGAFKIVQAAYDALSATHAPEDDAAAAKRPTREDEERATVSRFWQTAADDVTRPPTRAPKQPPIGRPPPRQAAPATRQPGQPPPQRPSWAQGGQQTPRRAPAPSNTGAWQWQPTMSKPCCPMYPFCVCCRFVFK